MGFTITLQTGKKDVHSGTTGGAARNPVAELAGLIAECLDARTGRVKIPGFYAGVRKLTAAERAGFGRAGFQSRIGVDTIVSGPSGPTPLGVDGGFGLRLGGALPLRLGASRLGEDLKLLS